VFSIRQRFPVSFEVARSTRRLAAADIELSTTSWDGVISAQLGGSNGWRSRHPTWMGMSACYNYRSMAVNHPCIIMVTTTTNPSEIPDINHSPNYGRQTANTFLRQWMSSFSRIMQDSISQTFTVWLLANLVFRSSAKMISFPHRCVRRKLGESLGAT
jgi:hypothetical protein